MLTNLLKAAIFLATLHGIHYFLGTFKYQVPLLQIFLFICVNKYFKVQGFFLRGARDKLRTQKQMFQKKVTVKLPPIMPRNMHGCVHVNHQELSPNRGR